MAYAAVQVQQILVSFSATVAAYVVYKLFKIVYRERASTLAVLPGPPSPSFLYGNMKQTWELDSSTLYEKWIQEYGSTISFKTFLGLNSLCTTDPKALNHVIMNTAIYEKPEAARYVLSRILGNGVLVVEGDKHKQQRRIMNPAFGGAQIRELTDIFIQKSIQLRDIWALEGENGETAKRVDVLEWLSKMTLDVIGLAGFNYEFNALTSDPKTNELNEAFSTLFRSGTRRSPIFMIRGMVPALRFLTEKRDADVRKASENMARIGSQLLRDSKAAISNDNEKIEKTSGKGRDLLSLLLRANTSTDLPLSQRMSDEDVLAQVPTFLVAGHETTSTATTWALFALTQNVEAQNTLREELLTVGTDNPTMDELNALPYLDAVVRESLRVDAPVPSSRRIAVKDDLIPLSELIKDKNGNVLDCIKIKKGQNILIPIQAMNRSKSTWGEDALQFRPERWKKVPEGASSIPGVWGNMLTFLGGPRACIGYRFSLVEMKALLFTLVRAFEFELAVPASDIIKQAGSTIVLRPLVASDLKGGNQMPLIIKPVRGQAL